MRLFIDAGGVKNVTAEAEQILGYGTQECESERNGHGTAPNGSRDRSGRRVQFLD